MLKTAVKTSSVNMDARQKLDLEAGNTVRVHQKIQEKGKTRIQVYEGLIIARKHGKEAGATITVRKTASGVGMEKTFPIYSPIIDKVEVIKKSKVRRSKLYYIRDKANKEIRKKMKNTILGLETEADYITEEAPVEEPKPETETTEENIEAPAEEAETKEDAPTESEPEK